VPHRHGPPVGVGQCHNTTVRGRRAGRPQPDQKNLCPATKRLKGCEWPLMGPVRRAQRRRGSRCWLAQGNPQAEPVVTRAWAASEDGARLPPSFSQSRSSVLSACLSWGRLRRSREANARPQAANNAAQRIGMFMICVNSPGA
jgi:hypothetical protein